MAVAALVVSIIAVIVASLGIWVSWRSANAARDSAVEARRSADAVEASERRERQPRLEVAMASPADHTADRVIYRLRNDGPQDLDVVTLYRPRPPDGITYPIAVTGDQSGWAADEINVGPLKLTEEVLFTLSCGSALILPDFRIRVDCHSGEDTWTFALELPNPRILPLSPDERATRRKTLMSALLEIEHDIATLSGPNWATIPLEDEHLRGAEQLIREHAPERMGPIRDLVGRIESFRVWLDQHAGTFRGDEIQTGRDPLLVLFSSAVPELQGLAAALDTPQASGSRWNS